MGCCLYYNNSDKGKVNIIKLWQGSVDWRILPNQIQPVTEHYHHVILRVKFHSPRADIKLAPGIPPGLITNRDGFVDFITARNEMLDTYLYL